VNSRTPALLAALVALFAGHAAHAQPADSAAAPRRVLKLVLAAEDAEAAALEDSLGELLGRLGITLSVSRAERLDLDDSSLARPSEGAIGTAWIDLRGTRARAVLVDRKGNVAARRDVGRDRSSAIVIEEIAHIVQSSVEELEADERRAQAPPPPPPPPAPRPESPPKPAPPAKEGVAFGVDGGGFFSGRAFGTGAEAVVGGGGMIGASLGRGDFRPALWLLGTYHVAFDVRGEAVDIHTKAATLRLAPTFRLFGGRRWYVEAGPEIGVDVLWTTPRANSAGLPSGRLGADSTDASPMLGALAAAHLAVGQGADLFVAAAADVDLGPHRFVAMEGKTPDPVFEQWRLRPALLLGFTFTLAGAPQYASVEGPR
jgi:hypothetical protein